MSYYNREHVLNVFASLSILPTYLFVPPLLFHTLRIYPFPQFAARLGNAYSSTNGDMINTGMQQEFASDEYLDPNDNTKNVIEWANAALSYDQMVPFMPEKHSDIINTDYVEMVVVRAKYHDF